MIYKWQLFISKHPQHLLDITFRHLDAISRLRPDAQRAMLVDFTKNVLLDFWNVLSDDGQWGVYQTNKAWLQCFKTKISLLIRLGFQNLDGTFMHAVEASYYKEFIETIGENVYVKSVEIAETQRQDGNISTCGATKQHVDRLAELLNLPQADSEDLQPIDANSFQKQFEQNLQQCNILFYDLDVNEATTTNSIGVHVKEEPLEAVEQHAAACNDFAGAIGHSEILPDSSTMLSASKGKGRAQGEFVQLPAVYNRNADAGRAGALGLNRDLLDLYSQIL